MDLPDFLRAEHFEPVRFHFIFSIDQDGLNKGYR